MAINTFIPTPAALASAIKVGSNGQPVVPQTAGPVVAIGPQPAGVTMPPAVPTESPWLSQYSTKLIDDATNVNDPVGHWSEGAGRLAALASGFYAKSQEEGRRKDREKAADAFMEKNFPDLAEAHKYGTTAEREQIRGAARQLLVQRSEEARKRAQSEKDYAGLRETALADPNLDPYTRAAILNPQTSKAALDSIFTLQREKLKLEAADKRSSESEKRKYEEKYRRYLDLFGGNEQRAKAAMLGVNEKTLRPPPENDPYVSAYEVETDPKDRAMSVAAARTAHQQNTKAFREQMTGAQAQLKTLGVVKNLIDDPKLYTGFGYDQVTMLKKIGTALGVKVEGVGQAELLNSIGNTLAKGAREGFPGAVSNFEFQRYLASVVSGNNTPAGNRAIYEYLMNAAKLQSSINEDVKAWKEYKRQRDPRSPAYLDDSFQTFHFDRQQERIAELEKMRAAADAAIAGGQNMSREDRLRANRSEAPAPQAPQQQAAPPAAQQAPQPVAPLRGPIYDTPASAQPEMRLPDPKALRIRMSIPQDAIKDLMSDPSPERRRQFDEIFGPGASDAVSGATR